MKPLSVSAIVAAYNSEKFIADTIRSILAQTVPVSEVIVVDDGSTDATPDILASFGGAIRVIRQENRGQSAARNRGIREARGEVIGFLDHDDLWTDDHTEVLLSHLADGDPYAIAKGMTRFMHSDGSGTRLSGAIWHPELIGAGLYRRQVFDAVGGFDETMREWSGEDLDLAIRIGEAGIVERRVDRPVLVFRRHKSNQTNGEGVVARGMIDALRKKLARAKASDSSKSYAP